MRKESWKENKLVRTQREGQGGKKIVQQKTDGKMRGHKRKQREEKNMCNMFIM